MSEYKRAGQKNAARREIEEIVGEETELINKEKAVNDQVFEYLKTGDTTGLERFIASLDPETARGVINNPKARELARQLFLNFESGPSRIRDLGGIFFKADAGFLHSDEVISCAKQVLETWKKNPGDGSASRGVAWIGEHILDQSPELTRVAVKEALIFSLENPTGDRHIGADSYSRAAVIASHFFTEDGDREHLHDPEIRAALVKNTEELFVDDPESSLRWRNAELPSISFELDFLSVDDPRIITDGQAGMIRRLLKRAEGLPVEEKTDTAEDKNSKDRSGWEGDEALSGDSVGNESFQLFRKMVGSFTLAENTLERRCESKLIYGDDHDDDDRDPGYFSTADFDEEMKRIREETRESTARLAREVFVQATNHRQISEDFESFYRNYVYDSSTDLSEDAELRAAWTEQLKPFFQNSAGRDDHLNLKLKKKLKILETCARAFDDSHLDAAALAKTVDDGGGDAEDARLNKQRAIAEVLLNAVGTDPGDNLALLQLLHTIYFHYKFLELPEVEDILVSRFLPGLAEGSNRILELKKYMSRRGGFYDSSDILDRPDVISAAKKGFEAILSRENGNVSVHQTFCLNFLRNERDWVAKTVKTLLLAELRNAGASINRDLYHFYIDQFWPRESSEDDENEWEADSYEDDYDYQEARVKGVCLYKEEDEKELYSAAFIGFKTRMRENPASGGLEYLYEYFLNKDRKVDRPDILEDPEVFESAKTAFGTLVRSETNDQLEDTICWIVITFLKNEKDFVEQETQAAYVELFKKQDAAVVAKKLNLYDRLEEIAMADGAFPELAEAGRIFLLNAMAGNAKELDVQMLDWIHNRFLHGNMANRADIDNPEDQLIVVGFAEAAALEGKIRAVETILDRYLLRDSVYKPVIVGLLIRHSLTKGDFEGMEERCVKFSEYPEIRQKAETARKALEERARKIGVELKSAAGVPQYQSEEWRMMTEKLLEIDGLAVADTGKEDIRLIRETILAHYESKRQTAITEPYALLASFFGDDERTSDLIWGYLGQKDKHQMLEPIKHFIELARDMEKDGKSRASLVKALFARAGMGSGLQAGTLKKIMSVMTETIWKFLETKSMYPDKVPAFSDKNHLNLTVVQNEITLLQTPEIARAVEGLPPEKVKLRAYADDLLRYPGINVEAIRNFLTNPSGFFASRTGAGENGGFVGRALDGLSPDKYPAWSAELSRDAIVEGSYDQLNSFPPIAVTWYDDSELREIRTALGVFSAKSEETVDSERAAEIKPILSKLIERASKESPAVKRELEERLQFALFAEYLAEDEAGIEKYRQWLEHKGEIFIGKAADYARKKGNGQKDTAEDADALKTELLHRLADLLASDDKETLMARSLVFWEKIRSTGFKTNMTHMAKQIRGEVFADTEEFFSKRLESANAGFLFGQANALTDKLEEEANLEWYSAEVLKPSDPEGAVAGTLSGTCDAFGHGKRAHFMANPGCAQFVLRHARGKKPEVWSTDQIIAQSLITDNREVFELPDQRWNFVRELTENEANIEEALQTIGFVGGTAEFLNRFANAPRLCVLDSVEVPQNSRNRFPPGQIFDVLRQAFDGLGAADPSYGTEVRIGTQYSYIEGDEFPTAPNKDLWVMPLAYSDNFGLMEHQDTSIVLRGRPEKEAVAADAPAAEGSEAVEVGQTPSPETKKAHTVRPATPRDTFPIAIMEDIAFRRTGGSGYITGPIAMTGSLQTSVLQSAHFDRAPLAYVDVAEDNEGRKEYCGYLLARVEQNGEVYIDDTASTGTEKGVGTRLLTALLLGLKKDPELKTKTIFMHCRGTTSAKALSRPNSIAGLKFIGYEVDGPSHEEIESSRSDALFSFHLLPIEQGVETETQSI